MSTYTVDKYLVGGPALTYAQEKFLRQTLQLTPFAQSLPSTILHTEGQSLMGDLNNALSVIVNFVVVIAALFGLELLLYRNYVHELNSLLSRISLLQSERDLFGLREPEEIRAKMFSLDACADLLGIISSLAGYYAQENAALMFNGITGAVHTRANSLKLNIQLKLLQVAHLRQA
jgi:hypothetical protein